MLKAQPNSGNAFNWWRRTWRYWIGSGDLKIKRAPKWAKVELKLVGIYICSFRHIFSLELG